MAVQDVGVPLELRGHVAGDPPPRGEPVAERPDVVGDVAVVLAPEPHVEDVLLAEHPPVALEVLAEEDLRRLLGHRAVGPLSVGHHELDLVGGHDVLGGAHLGPQVTRDRAEVPARPHDDRRFCDVVDSPKPVHTFEALDGVPGELLRTAPFEEVVVQLDAADAVARHLVVARLDHPSRHAAGQERPDRLAYPPRPVLVEVEPEGLDGGGSDPARAHLVARKVALVDHRDVEARAPELPGAGGARRPSADHDGVESFQAPVPPLGSGPPAPSCGRGGARPASRYPRGYMCSRVIGTAFELPGTNTTWKS